MSEYESYLEVKVGSEKSFGIVLAILFLLMGLYPLIGGGEVRKWSLLVAIVLISVAFLKPKTLYIPNKLWFMFGKALGTIMTPIFMTVLYFITIVPTGLTMKLMRKDLLRQKLEKNVKSYWIEREQPVGSMKNQF